VTSVEERTEELYRRQADALHRRTDVMFAGLMGLQFVASVLAAAFISPRTWSGSIPSVHIHLLSALVVGLCLTSLPVALVILRRGRPMTRYVIAAAQMLYSALLIHLTGGRIETHFHVFGSLAFLAIYRDWRVLVPATIVVTVDHVVRGIFWPQSVFGVLTSGVWRAFEHAGWVIFEDVFLVYSCVQSTREMRAVSHAQARLETSNASIERQIEERTRELAERTEALRESEERYAIALHGSQDAIWDWDLGTNRVYYSARWRDLLCDADEELTDSPEEWFRRISSGELAGFHRELSAFIEGAEAELDTEITMHTTCGQTRWMRCRAAAVRDETGRPVRIAGSLSDLTELKRTQDDLRRLAQHDRLTGLPNRELFANRLERALARARRNPESPFAVLFFDFDRFKVINDSLGHQAGDELLKSIARRLSEHIRETDTAARFGGDEFVLLLERLCEPDDAVRKASELLRLFERPHVLGEHEVVSTASIGIVVHEPRYEDAATMIRDADAAMYQAKLSGRSQYRLFDREMHDAVTRRLSIEQELRRAVERGQFELWYQPILSLAGGGVAGVEALLRWRHPERGLLMPDAFIPIAEETGLIIPIGEWVMREACRAMRSFSALPGGPSYVAVNVSRRQLLHPEIIGVLRTALDESGIEPRRLKIEITESAVMEDRANVVAIMREINALGVELAMDDFGTGYSSLSCLHSFPISILKIDREFVIHMTRKREFAAVMLAIITLAGHLNLTVIAEGIETPEELAQLQAMECAYGQGYHFSRPVPASEAPAVFKRLSTRRIAA